MYIFILSSSFPLPIANPLPIAHCSILHISTWWQSFRPTSGEGSQGLGQAVGWEEVTRPQLQSLISHVIDSLAHKDKLGRKV